jgi:hypothetical protein
MNHSLRLGGTWLLRLVRRRWEPEGDGDRELPVVAD